MIRPNSTKTISKKGLDLIKKYEGLKLEAYKDPAGILTIGYGHTKTVKPGMVINKDMADLLLKTDIMDAESAVRALVDIELTQNQFDALVSFVFNVGRRNFQRSTLLKLLNAGKLLEAGEEFMKWTKARQPGGLKDLPGLIKRRACEKALFLSKE
ncbi:lysozyme [Ignavibacterium sp.]|uniref:lysozyme n=1 Tax=Ignavibacterium sp. TaxID=2651167 RepID=UPI0021FF830D|nr:lysozyme [Ignavibacterium sp.]BDQ03495.1 MAG: lysozyme [Ignavibacterium sp.]